MAELTSLTESQVRIATTRIDDSDRDIARAETVASRLETVAADLTRFRGDGRARMENVLRTYEPNLSIPQPKTYVLDDNGERKLQEFLERVEQEARELIDDLSVIVITPAARESGPT